MATKNRRSGPGRLLVIGGAEDPDEKNMTILPHFVKLCGGRRSRIVICGSPSEKPLEKERKYRRVFEKIGAGEIFEAKITNRHQAENEELTNFVERATGVFFTGGDQLRLTSLMAGTKFGQAVREGLRRRGLVVAGTSAGATAMSSTMVIGGNEEGSVRRADVDLAPGLGYWRDVCVDTHFAQRGRVSRMLTIFAQNPQVLGIGIDENTAVEVEPGKVFHVIGQGAVFVFDGTVTYSNAPEASNEDVLALTDSLVHVLPAGFSFNLRAKRPILPNGRKVPAKGQ